MRHSFAYIWVFSEKFNWGEAWKKDTPQMCMAPCPGVEIRMNKKRKREKSAESQYSSFSTSWSLAIYAPWTVLVLCLHLPCHGRLYSSGLTVRIFLLQVALCQVLGHSHEKRTNTATENHLLSKGKEAWGRRIHETGRSVGKDCYERTLVA